MKTMYRRVLLPVLPVLLANITVRAASQLGKAGTQLAKVSLLLGEISQKTLAQQAGDAKNAKDLECWCENQAKNAADDALAATTLLQRSEAAAKDGENHVGATSRQIAALDTAQAMTARDLGEAKQVRAREQARTAGAVQTLRQVGRQLGRAAAELKSAAAASFAQTSASDFPGVDVSAAGAPPLPADSGAADSPDPRLPAWLDDDAEALLRGASAAQTAVAEALQSMFIALREGGVDVASSSSPSSSSPVPPRLPAIVAALTAERVATLRELVRALAGDAAGVAIDAATDAGQPGRPSAAVALDAIEALAQAFAHDAEAVARAGAAADARFGELRALKQRQVGAQRERAAALEQQLAAQAAARSRAEDGAAAAEGALAQARATGGAARKRCGEESADFAARSAMRQRELAALAQARSALAREARAVKASRAARAGEQPPPRLPVLLAATAADISFAQLSTALDGSAALVAALRANLRELRAEAVEEARREHWCRESTAGTEGIVSSLRGEASALVAKQRQLSSLRAELRAEAAGKVASARKVRQEADEFRRQQQLRSDALRADAVDILTEERALLWALEVLRSELPAGNARNLLLKLVTEAARDARASKEDADADAAKSVAAIATIDLVAAKCVDAAKTRLTEIAAQAGAADEKANTMKEAVAENNARSAAAEQQHLEGRKMCDQFLNGLKERRAARVKEGSNVEDALAVLKSFK